MRHLINWLVALGLVPFAASLAEAANCDLRAQAFYSDVTVVEMSDCISDNPEGELSTRDEQGNTPLHLAIVHSPETEIIRLLISLGADIQALNAEQESPLHALAADGTVPSHVAAFIAGGGDINESAPDDVCKIGNCSTRPIHRVAGRPDAIEMLRAFLAAGADATVEDPRGRTPLHYAAEMSTWEAVEILIADGADPNSKDFEGVTPLQLAAQRGPGDDASAGADERVVRLLLWYGSDANELNEDDQSPLLLAAAYTDNPAIWMALFEATDPETRCQADKKGRTVKEMIDANPNLPRDAGYWQLNQDCL